MLAGGGGRVIVNVIILGHCETNETELGQSKINKVCSLVQQDTPPFPSLPLCHSFGRYSLKISTLILTLTHEDSNQKLPQSTLATYDAPLYKCTTFCCKGSKILGDLKQTVVLFWDFSPHCDLGLEDSNPNSQSHTHIRNKVTF